MEMILPRPGGRPQKWPVHKLAVMQFVQCDSLNEAYSVRHQIRKLGGKARMEKVAGEGWRVRRVA